MNLRRQLVVLLVMILCFAFTVNAHVPVSVDGNYDIITALPVEKPTTSYVIYGELHKAEAVAWYQLRMNPGDHLVISLMVPGYNTKIPDMIVMSPGVASSSERLLKPVSVPQGYAAEIIRGQPPHKADYEPFTPAAVFEVASYSKEITAPGLYYLAVVSPVDDTRYSIATGYTEEFTPSEWILVPLNVISTHLWEGQSIITILTPFLAVVILGFVMISRREKRKGSHFTCSCWLATIAGLCYIGGAAITLVQWVRAIAVTGPSSSIALTLIFAVIPIALGIWALRMGRTSSKRTIKERAFLALIALLGLIFWAGLVIGPLLAIGAAVIPDQSKSFHTKIQ